MSTSITLSSTWKARFPDRCILCGHHAPAASMPLSANPNGSWRRPGNSTAGSPVQVPACLRCRELMERQSQLRQWGVVVSILVALALYVVVLICYHGPLVNVVRAGGLVFFLLPYFVWEALFPLPINVGATKTSITYSFENELYAIEFLRLNRPSQRLADKLLSDVAEADAPMTPEEIEAS